MRFRSVAGKAGDARPDERGSNAKRMRFDLGHRIGIADCPTRSEERVSGGLGRVGQGRLEPDVEPRAIDGGEEPTAFGHEPLDMIGKNGAGLLDERGIFAFEQAGCDFTRIGKEAVVLGLPAIRIAVRASRKTGARSEEHTSELQSLMRISYAVFCLKKKTNVSAQTNYPKQTHNNISSIKYQH